MSSTPPTRRRTKRITVFVTPELHDAITEGAQWKEQEVSDFVRNSLFETLIEMGVVPYPAPRGDVVRQDVDDPKGKPGTTSHLHS